MSDDWTEPAAGYANRNEQSRTSPRKHRSLIDRIQMTWHTENASHNRHRGPRCTFVCATGSPNRMSVKPGGPGWSCPASSSRSSGL